MKAAKSPGRKVLGPYRCSVGGQLESGPILHWPEKVNLKWRTIRKKETSQKEILIICLPRTSWTETLHLQELVGLQLLTSRLISYRCTQNSIWWRLTEPKPMAKRAQAVAEPK